MNPDVFFENFELLADAPNGVQKLRELILQLAVRGKLVTQDPNDEPASILLKNIEDKKEKLVKDKKVRKSKPLLPPTIDEIPCELPKSWEWVRLGNIGNAIRDPIVDGPFGSSINTKEDYISTGIPVIRMVNVKPFKFINNSLKFISEEKYETLKRHNILPNDVLLGKVGSIGESCIFPEYMGYGLLSTTGLCRFRVGTIVTPKYLCCYLNSISSKLKELASINVQPFLNMKTITNVPFPLPPLAEQKRIVAKVDELMALCDKLEAHRQKKQEIQSKLNNAALDRMLSAENQEEFDQHWQRICENFDLLYDNPENVEKLKKYILRLGVEGKLVPTEAELAKIEGRSYESADCLLKNVLIDRNEKEIKLKNKDNFESVELNDLDETLPEGWIWTSIGHITECLDHMRIPVNKKEREERVGNIPYYGANGRVGWIDECIFDEPLVLVVEDETFIGRQKPFCYKIVGKSWVNNHAHVLRPTRAVDVDFLNYSLAYYPFTPLTSGTTGRKKLTKSTLIAVPYKLPPLAEQKRIVEKVEQLMSLCDELEAKLRKEREDSEKLIEAVVKGLLEGAVTEKTELEKPILLQVAVIKLK